MGYFDIKVIEVHDLIAGVYGNGCFPDFAFGLHNTRVVDAMIRSAQSGQWTEVG